MMSKYLISIFVVILSLTSVLALQGSQQTDKFWSNSAYTNSVNGVQEIIYTCSNSACSSQGSLILNQNTGSSNTLVFNYPYNPSSTESNPDYYSHFSFAECYLPEEWIEWDWGYGYVIPTINYHLTKAEDCHSPIDSFSVTNRNYVNEPVVVDMVADLEADAFSAFTDLVLNWFPAGYEDYYSAETLVKLTIKNSNGGVVYSDDVELNILMDSSENVRFEWTPSEEGTYTARVTTDVTDCQCSSSSQEFAEKVFTVLPERPKNEAYTIINNLEADPQFAREGDVITITYDKISNYADNNHGLTPVPTRVEYKIAKGSTVVFTKSLLIPANANALNSERVSFEWTPSEEGFYGISVKGIAESSLVEGKPNHPDTATISYTVAEAEEIRCSLDSECGLNGYVVNYCQEGNVWRDYVAYTCNNPGTVESYCSSVRTPGLFQTCEYGCLLDQCLPAPECTQDSDCGQKVYGNKYCQGDNVVREVTNPLCNVFKVCSSQTITETVEECDSDEYCEDGKCVEEEDDDDDDDKKDKGSSGWKKLFFECEAEWVCGGWSECYDGIKTRTCTDLNHCESEIGKPIERIGCQTQVVEPVVDDAGFNLIYWMLGVLIVLVLVILFVYFGWR